MLEASSGILENSVIGLAFLNPASHAACPFQAVIFRLRNEEGGLWKYWVWVQQMSTDIS